MSKFIFEMTVYCGRRKEFRVLNLNSGTVYSNSFETPEECDASIEDGVERAGCIVKRVSRTELLTILSISLHNSEWSEKFKEGDVVECLSDIEFVDDTRHTKGQHVTIGKDEAPYYNVCSHNYKKVVK